MKIIGRQPPPPPSTWWHGIEAVCPKPECRAILQLEPGDPIKDSRDTFLEPGITVPCPSCNLEFFLHKPFKSNQSIG